MPSGNLYQQLLEATNEHLGTNIFVGDLIHEHLNIRPDKLSKTGLRTIKAWLLVTASMLIESQAKVDKYERSIDQLAGGRSG